MDVLIKRAEQETSARQNAPKTAISVSDELRKLAQLRSEGLLSEAEFAAQKAKLLG
jgi:predicted Zn-dependent peptidase